MGFCPVESHLLLLSVVLFCGTLSLFLISNCRLRLLSFSYVCFVSSESRPVSEGTCIFKPLSPVKRYRGLLCVWLFCHILSYFCLFMGTVCVRYFGLDVCHGDRFLVTGLCYIALCFTVTLYRRLPFFISNRWSIIPWLLVVLNNVIDIHSICLWVGFMCVQLSERGWAGGAGGWESCVLHLDWTHRVPRALLEVWYLQWEAKEWGGTVPYQRYSHITLCHVVKSKGVSDFLVELTTFTVLKYLTQVLK